MKLAVYSHKPCWRSPGSPTGYATDGGFPMQMAAISELFDETVLVVPCAGGEGKAGERQLAGHNLSVRPVDYPRGAGIARKLDMAAWTMRNRKALFGTLRWADAVHAPIPGDIGTIGMLLAWAARKPLFVRHCGNWSDRSTVMRRFCHDFMVRAAGGRSVMLATGGGDQPPSATYPNVKWVFSTSLSEEQIGRMAVAHAAPTEGRLRLVTVGRQEQGKGTDLLIGALPAVAQVWPGATLDVVGDGSRLDRLRDLARASGVSERVRFLGSVSHASVLEALQSSDLFCFPTRSEGFPKAVLEALACGLPVITTPVSVLPHLLRSGCGVLIPERPSASVLAAAVLEAVADPAAYRSMSLAALGTAAQYTLERWRADIGMALEAAWQQPLRCR